MAKKKSTTYLVSVLITGPDCRDGDRLYQPGEIANVAAELAQEWTSDERAVYTAEEADNANW
jgi:hypothetical protein